MNTPFINAAIGNALVITQGGSWLNEQLIEAIETKGAAGEQALKSLESASAQITAANSEIAKMKEQIANLMAEKDAAAQQLADITAERDNLITEKAQLEIALNEAKQNASSDTDTLNASIAEKDEQIANLQQQLTDAEQAHATALADAEQAHQTAIADAEQAHAAALAAKDEEINALKAAGSAAPTPAPGEGGFETAPRSCTNVITPGMSLAEMTKALNDRQAQLAGRTY